MAKSKSCVSFFRKELKIKGRTQHNGRGLYDMDFDCTEDELKDRISNKIEDWCAADMVEAIEQSDGRIAVTIKKELFPDQYYRKLIMSPHFFGVGMAALSSPAHQ